MQKNGLKQMADVESDVETDGRWKKWSWNGRQVDKVAWNRRQVIKVVWNRRQVEKVMPKNVTDKQELKQMTDKLSEAETGDMAAYSVVEI